MAIGPVQLIVLGFDEPEFKGEVLAELDRLKENDVVRVIDGLAVHKDEKGEVTTLKRTDLSDEEAAEFGGVVGALIGLGIAGEEGAEGGAAAGAEATAEGVDIFHEQDVVDVMGHGRTARRAGSGGAARGEELTSTDDQTKEEEDVRTRSKNGPPDFQANREAHRAPAGGDARRAEYYDDEPQAAPPPAAPAEPDMTSQLQELAQLKRRTFSRRKSSR